ncbi:MAG: phenylacetate-CoA oxygenase/reductase subunit PaaK [Gammaproteobacteria bacterium]|nr:phenylacetate-CoA oxygenase/reductase subunit PaaK [Gammaproteobacteria bacterium]
MAQRFYPIPVAEVRHEADDAVSVQLAVPADLAARFAFLPGQHLTLRREFDGLEQRRSYSLCSGVDTGEWRIGIRALPGGVFSTWANQALRPGDIIECMPPDGLFSPVLASVHAKHYLLIAAGSGITPLLCIARSVLSREPRSQVTLLYGNRRPSTVMFREDLEDLKNSHLRRLSVHHVFSREAQEVALANGRLDAAKLQAFLDQLIAPASLDEVFLCGPNAMLDELTATLRTAGVAAAHLHLERFGNDGVAGVPRVVTAVGTAATPAQTAGAEALVTVIAEGATRSLRLAPGGATILEAARAAGIDLPFSCKSGVCSTCRAKLLVGTVEMRRNFALMPADLAAGFVLTCQARPTSGQVTVSFDDR